MAEKTGDSFSSFPSDLFGSMLLDSETPGFMADFQLGNFSFNTVQDAHLEILEQPKQRGFRFRYPCEGPSHGGLPGEKSQKGKKSYPSVQINNYIGPARIEVSLVTISDPPRPHAHTLVGKHVTGGSYVVEVDAEQGMTATFPNLGIQHVTKKKVKEVLKERYIQQHKIHAMTVTAAAAMINAKPQNTVEQSNMDCGEASTSGANENLVFDKNIAQAISDEEMSKIDQMAEEQSKSMNLSAVKLCFQTYLPDEQGHFVRCLTPVYSREIYDSKAAAASELRICRMDRKAGAVTGGDEVFLLCDKVQKEDIEIRFFDVDNMSGGQPWEDFGKFSTSDVHRQFAIVFRTPTYWDTAIEQPVTVQLELRRKTDNERSNAMDFTYKPTEFDPEQIGAKRRKTAPHFGDYSDPGPGGSGGAGAGAGGGGGLGFLDPNVVSQFFSMYQAPGGFTGSGGGGVADSGAGGSVRGGPWEHGVTPKEGDGEGVYSGVGGSSIKGGPWEHHGGSGALLKGGVRDGEHHGGMPMVDDTRQSGDLSHSSHGDGGACRPQERVESDASQYDHYSDHSGDSQSGGSRPSQDGANPDATNSTSLKEKMNDAYFSLASYLRTIMVMIGVQHFAQTKDERFILNDDLATSTDEDGDSPLHVATIHGHTNIVSSLLNACSADTHYVNQFNKLRQTPLHLAVITKQPHVIKALLHAGADVSLQDRHGNTPVHLASDQQSPECLRALVSRERVGNMTSEDFEVPGLDVQNYEGLTALHVAVLNNRLENLKILNSTGADMNAMDGKSGYSPLHHAVETSNLAITGYLALTAKTDINITSLDGNTALHLASGLGLTSITALLVGAGADCDIMNDDNATPVDMATTSEVCEVLERTVDPCQMSTISANLGQMSLSDRRQHNFDNLGDLSSVLRHELVASIELDWSSLAEQLGLSYYENSLKIQKNPAEHLLDIYQTLDGSTQRFRRALLELGNDKALSILNKWFEHDDGCHSDADSAYSSLATSDRSLGSLPSLKGARPVYDVIQEAQLDHY